MAIISSLTSHLGLLDLLYFTLMTLVLHSLCQTVFGKKSTANSPPIVGVPNTIFGRFKAGISCVTSISTIFLDGYSRFSRSGLPFQVPNLFSGYITVLPPSLIPELKSAPEYEMSMSAAFEEEGGSSHVFFTRWIEDKPYHLTLLRQTLTQNLGKVMKVVEDEVSAAFKEEWEAKFEKEGWTEIKLWDSTLDVVARVSHRTFVGLPLCREKEFLQNCIDFSVGIVLSGWGLRSIPMWLRPLFAPIVTFRNRQRVKLADRYLGPIISERMAIVEHNSDPKNSDNQLPEPDDVLQWTIRAAQPLRLPHYNRHEILLRILMINFVSIHTTTMTFMNAFLNLACFSSPSTPYISLLRAELETVSSRDGDQWTRKKFGMLRGMDSFLKESLRLYGIPTAALMRKVVKKGGYRFTDGTWIEEGTKVCVNASAAHWDENNYVAAKEFHGFRFGRPITGAQGEESAGKERELGAGLVSTRDDFLSFGHGKHACPGRFFAASELKMLLKYVLENYEIRPITTGRPENKYLWMSIIPDTKITVGVRKRKIV